MDRYRISQLADRVGVPATTLRYYETQGLLPAERTPAGYRTYDDHDVERIRFIGTAKNLGLSLDRIRDLLGAWQHGACRDVRDRLRPLVEGQITRAEHRLVEISAFRDHLVAALARLDRLPARDTPCDPTCAFLAPPTTEQPTMQHHQTTDPPPIACTLTATEHAERAARWRTILTGTTRTPLPDNGIRVHLPAGHAEEIAALVAAESRCCPFLTFRLTFTGSGVELDAHAPADATALLDDLLGAATTSSTW